MVTCSGSDVNGLISQYVTAKYLYHSGEGESPLTDAEFDALERHLLDLKICSPEFFRTVGSAVREPRDAVPLPEPMGSLEKMRTDEEISKWLYSDLPKGQHLYCVMAKVDGLSVELVYDDGHLTSAYTRGDGVEGTLITRHLFLVPGVPHHVPSFAKRVVVRGELYMPEAEFKQHYASEYSNSRNFVAGVTRRKQPTAKDLGHMRLAAYHIYNPDLSKMDMLNTLKESGFTVPYHYTATASELTQQALSTSYAAIAEQVEHLIDGLVIEVNAANIRARVGFETNSLNPAYGRAFKVDLATNMANATVEYVDWGISKDGYLKPVVKLKPISLGGVTIKQATAYNAKFVVDNGLGPGAEIVLIRSGDVIPKIIEVVSKVSPQLPEAADVGPYEWNATGVDLVVVGESSEQKFEGLVHFFKTLGIENLSSGVLRKFFSKGYETPEAILAMTAEDMIANIDGVKKASADKFSQSIKKALAEVYLPVLMQASGSFGRGFGESTAEIFYKHFNGDIFTPLSWPSDILMSELCMINGVSDKTAELFITGLPKFKARLDALLPFMTLKTATAGPINDVLKGAPFVFSGFRSDALEEKIVSLGGTISSSVSGKTKYLVVKNKTSTSSSVEKARKLGISILDTAELELLLSNNENLN